jgi:hypothetical protein
VLAGRATFTVDTQDDYYTIHVLRKQYDNTGLTCWHVFQQTRKGRYIGTLNAASGDLCLTSKSWLQEHDLLLAVVQIVFECIWNRTELPPGWMIMHVGKCGACGRKLTTPESLARGIGPRCSGQLSRRTIKRTEHLHAANYRESRTEAHKNDQNSRDQSSNAQVRYGEESDNRPVERTTTRHRG